MALKIKKDIREAATLPASFYRDADLFQNMKEGIFLKSWQWVSDNPFLGSPDTLYPFFFMEHFLDEPLILVKHDEGIRCLSNVCTHRGNIMIHHPSRAKKIICGYHGRRFNTQGEMEFMPEFEEARDFPRACDHLPSFTVNLWKNHVFVGLEPAFDIASALRTMEERIGFLPLGQFKRDTKRSRTYLVNAHWALYCDNYLEGFHIPFVHHDLNDALEYGDYVTETYDHMVLQIGYCGEDQDRFELPEGHVDYGKNVAAYYYWVFPNMMFNFYPWGLSVNIVKPLALDRTKVSFISFVFDESKIDVGAGADIDKVEREDEFVVENVHRGLQSRYYQAGRFSPKREKGVHHFHSLLAHYMLR
ncbi:MAG: SRPBCC family protein [Flavobacteriaceae bacterium]